MKEALRRIFRGLGIVTVGLCIVAALYGIIYGVIWLAGINAPAGFAVAVALLLGLLLLFAWVIGE